jgi:hypothetical protein
MSRRPILYPETWTTNVDDVIDYATFVSGNDIHVTRTATGLRIMSMQNGWLYEADPVKEESDERWKVRAWNTAGEKRNPKPSWDRMLLWAQPNVNDREAAMLAVEVFMAEYPEPTIEILIDDRRLLDKCMLSTLAAENVLQAIFLTRNEAFGFHHA